MEIYSTVDAVAVITDAFSEGAKRFQTWREKRKNRKSGEAELSDSLESGKPDVEAEYEKLKERYGEGFEMGDETSRASLSAIAIELDRTLVGVLKKSESIPRFEFEPSALWQISEKCRKQTILRLGELGLRILRNQQTASSRPDFSGATRFHGTMPPISTAPSWSENQQTTSTGGHIRSSSVAMMLEKVKYARPTRYSMSEVETYIPPEDHYGQARWNTPNPEPPWEDDTYSRPVRHSLPRLETPAQHEGTFSQPDWNRNRSIPRQEPIWEDSVDSYPAQYSVPNTQTYEQPRRDYIHSSTPRPEHQFLQDTPLPLRINKISLPSSLQVGSPTSPNYQRAPAPPPRSFSAAYSAQPIWNRKTPSPPMHQVAPIAELPSRSYSPEEDEYPSELLASLSSHRPPVLQQAPPPPPPPRPRPFSVSYSSAPPISDLNTSSRPLPMPNEWDRQESPVSASSKGRLRMPDRRASGFNHDTRGPQDARRSTIAGSRSPFQELITPPWSPEPTQEQWGNAQSYVNSVSPQQDFLQASDMGHFRMPTPVNHGGHEFQS